MRNIVILSIGVLSVGVCVAASASAHEPAPFANDSAPALGLELELENELGVAAAVRRISAMRETDPVRAAGWYFLAASDYSRMGNINLSGKMLDRAEDQAADEIAIPAALLRAENAYATGGFGEAAYYFQNIENSPSADPDLADYARRGRAATMLLSYDYAGAADLFDEGSDEWLKIRDYRKGSDKSPRIGGILGIIPGLGYAYSGEYVNAIRSVILNSLFIWGMVETAERDQWAAFSVITFFELTWYSGSIYGGIDAAHRRNRERLADVVESVRGPKVPAADTSVFPLIKLRFDF